VGHKANVMAALPNIGGALCSTPQSLADVHYQSAVLPRREIVEISWGAQTSPTDLSRSWAEVHYIVRTYGEDIAV